MTKLEVVNHPGERHFSIQDERGLNVGDLRKIINAMPPEADNAVLCLCIDDVESYTTRIVVVKNEGDNSILWFKVDQNLSRQIEDSFHENQA